MKKVKLGFAAIAVLALVSCGDKKEAEPFGKSTEESATTETTTETNPLVDQGKEIFEGKGTCVACHQPSTKVVGPSLKDISATYKEKGASIVTFLKGEAEPLVDPTQFEVMKANFAITKQMKEEELKALEAYIESF
ncbi:c-type cytochrome [Flavobacterium sp. U410]|jgi:cytochrome c